MLKRCEELGFKREIHADEPRMAVVTVDLTSPLPLQAPAA